MWARVVRQFVIETNNDGFDYAMITNVLKNRPPCRRFVFGAEECELSSGPLLERRCIEPQKSMSIARACQERERKTLLPPTC